MNYTNIIIIMTKTTDSLLKSKKGLIVGIANDRSLAWGIAEQVYKSGV